MIKIEVSGTRLLRPGVVEADLALDVICTRQPEQRRRVAHAQQLHEISLGRLK
jgi:hypothetical protein